MDKDRERLEQRLKDSNEIADMEMKRIFSLLKSKHSIDVKKAPFPEWVFGMFLETVTNRFTTLLDEISNRGETETINKQVLRDIMMSETESLTLYFFYCGEMPPPDLKSAFFLEVLKTVTEEVTGLLNVFLNKI